MSVADINSLRDDLLVMLAAQGATNHKPQDVLATCRALRPEIDWSVNGDLARSAGWLLVRATPALAKKVTDSDKPGLMLLALTAAGKSAASGIFEQRRPVPLFQQIKAAIQKDWIAITALIISAIALFKPGS